jgi:hypothetical protein
MVTLNVPVEVALVLEHFATMTKELFGWLDRPVFFMNSFVLA